MLNYEKNQCKLMKIFRYWFLLESNVEMYRWALNNEGIRLTDLHTVENLNYNLTPQKLNDQ